MKISTISNTSKKSGFRHFFFKIIDFVTASHLWISMAALALYGHTLIVFQGSFTIDALSGVIFFGTWSGYGFLKLRKAPLTIINSKDHDLFRIFWFLSVIIGLPVAVFCMGFLSVHLRWLILFGMVMTGLYSLPIIGTAFRIRNIPLLKIFLISVTWTWVTLLLPWAQINEQMSTAFPWLAIFSRFAFIFAITLPFDFRDRYTDHADGTLTFPLLIGWRKTKLIAYSLLWVGIGLEIAIECSAGIPETNGIVNMLTYLLAIAMVSGVNPSRNNRYYVFGIDGLMFLPFVLTWLVQKII